MMKYRLLFLYILGMTVAACNNDLPDELFVKRVVIAENGFQDLRVEYPEDGTVNIVERCRGSGKGMPGYVG